MDSLTAKRFIFHDMRYVIIRLLKVTHAVKMFNRNKVIH